MDQRRMCPHCRAFITSKDRTCPYCNEKVGPKAVERRDGGELLGGFIPQARFTTAMILIVNFGLFAGTVAYSSAGGNEGAMFSLDPQTLRSFGAKTGLDIARGQLWRLITAGFLHGGIMHILMNSWAMFDLGAQVEEIYGSSRLIVFYFLATFFGFYASVWWTPALSVGASAGVFGLIGAMIAFGARSRTSMGSAIRGMYLRWAIYGVLIGLIPGFRMDNAAHLGGLAAGFSAAYLGGTPRIAEAWSEKAWRMGSYICLGLTAWCFLQMYRWLAAVSR